ncbi:MAG: glycosyltransferase family 2 protein [Thermotogota bacterium]|nr:glycosyltransferase family 2 protein [Thermotogota bacterium]
MSNVGNESPLVYIVSANYNNFDLTSGLINSLNGLTYPNYRILIVDDYSTDGSGDKLYKTFPGVSLIKNEKNLNYCKSFNNGFREALKNGAEYVFIVNNDTSDFSPDYLEEILKAFNENASVGMVGTWCYDYDGGIRCDGTAKDRFGVPMETPTEGYIIKREVFEKIGLFDENLVIYYEDLDFIVRLRKAGYKTKTISSVSFAHLGGATVSKIPFKRNYYRVRNGIWFIRRYCKGKPFGWKIMQYAIAIEPHIQRLVKSFIHLELKNFVIIGFAIVMGLGAGFITNWKPEVTI